MGCELVKEQMKRLDQNIIGWIIVGWGVALTLVGFCAEGGTVCDVVQCARKTLTEEAMLRGDDGGGQVPCNEVQGLVTNGVPGDLGGTK